VPVPLVIVQGPLAPCTCSSTQLKSAANVPLPSAHVKTRPRPPFPSQLPVGQSGGEAGECSLVVVGVNRMRAIQVEFHLRGRCECRGGRPDAERGDADSCGQASIEDSHHACWPA
jgi:hypothetical protein